MNTEFIKRQTQFLLQLFVFAVFIFGIHRYVLSHFAEKKVFFFSLWQIYVFHYAITAVLCGLVNYKISQGKTEEIFIFFMIGTVVKMGFVIVFLYPLLFSEFGNKKPDVFNFFISYFLFLAFEVFSITKFSQKKQ